MNKFQQESAIIQKVVQSLRPGLLHTPDNKALIDIYKFNTRLTYYIRSKEFKDWGRCFIYDRTKALCYPVEIDKIFKKILDKLEILALYEAPEAELVSQRVFEYKRTVYLNLADEK